MDIIFYRLQDELNDVNKLRTLTSTATYEPITITGTLRSSASKIAPVIDFAKEVTYFNGWNYCYIADFNRYYFVDNVVSVRAGVTSVSFRVDVLTSFLTQNNINNIEGFIGRSSYRGIANRQIADRLIQLKEKLEIKETKTYKTTLNNLINTELYTGGETTGLAATTIAITTIVGNRGFGGSVGVYPIPDVLKDLYNKTPEATYSQNYVYGRWFKPTDGQLTCVCTSGTLGKINLACIQDDRIYSYIKSVVAFPFLLANTPPTSTNGGVDFDYGKDPDTIVLPDANKVKYLADDYSNFLIVDDFIVYDQSLFWKYNLNQNYLGTSNYLSIEYYVPYYGWIKLDPNKVLNHRLITYYNVCYSTGTAIVSVYDVDGKMLIFNSTCQIGVKIGLSSTNAYEVAMKQTSYTTNYVLGTLTSFALGVVGAVTENPYLTMAGVTGVVTNAAQFVNNTNTNFDYGQSNISDDNTAIFTAQVPLIRWTLKAPIFDMNDTTDLMSFEEHLGIPVNKVLKLSSCIDANKYHTYTEITDLHTTTEGGLYSINDITYNEVEELKKLCSAGIYL